MLVLLLLLIIIFCFGGIFVHPLLFALVAFAVLALFTGPGAGWYGGTRRW